MPVVPEKLSVTELDHHKNMAVTDTAVCQISSLQGHLLFLGVAIRKNLRENEGEMAYRIGIINLA